MANPMNTAEARRVDARRDGPLLSGPRLARGGRDEAGTRAPCHLRTAPGAEAGSHG